MLMGSMCFSATLYVDDNAPNDPGPGDPNICDPLEDGSQVHPFDAIQEAINAADANNNILVADGTYTGDGNRDMDFLGKAIAVQGQNGPENCMIDCQGTEQDPHRAFIFQSGETHNSILSGFSIINGYADEKIVIPDTTSPIMTTFGGSIFSENASPVIANCMFENCTSQNGGAIYCSLGSPVIINSTFRNNLGGSAAIQSNDCSITVANCCFVANDSAGQTALVLLPILDTITIEGAGAMLLYGGMADISNCIFSGNSGLHNGGVTMFSTKTRIDNCVFVGNRGWEGASLSGVFIGESEEIVNSKMYTVNNCIFRDNNNLDGSEVFDGIGLCITDTGAPFFWQIYEINYSSVEVLDPNLPGFGNIDTDPLFVNPGYWDLNSTQEDWNDDTWIEGDYHLKSAGWRWDRVAEQWTWDSETSPCIDASNPGMALGDEPVTLDVDPLNRLGENIRVNMGAYGGTEEASVAPVGWALLCDLDNSGDVTLDDFIPMIEAWLQTEENQPSDVSRNGIVNLEDMALLGQDWLKTTTWH